MACPYFIPAERMDDSSFVHPARLPLGAAFRGVCAAPGHDGAVPSDEELKQCNMGYARNCSRVPLDRKADAVRFSILRDRDGQVSICYVSELNYLPQEHGNLHYEVAMKRWSQIHPQSAVQRLADSFLRVYLERRSSTSSSPLAAQ